MEGQQHTDKELGGYLGHLIYDLYVLATATCELRKSDCLALTEVYKTAGLLKLRAIHDFFYRPGCCDSIKMKFFERCNPKKPPEAEFQWPDWLALQSVHTFVVHLDKARTTKRYEKDDPYSGKKKGDVLPQPKYEKGNQQVVDASVRLMREAKGFVESLLPPEGSLCLNEKGREWWKGFRNALARCDGSTTVES